jgi:hypothetical protein
MFSLFWSESKKRAAHDEREFRAEGWEHFKREVNRATDAMLGYEIRYYQETFFSIGLAGRTPSQMELSGGASWVSWMDRRANLELQYVVEELGRRGRLDICENAKGPVNPSFHAWDLIELSDHRDDCRELRKRWGF